ncbi:extracellular solute-binding protein [Acuticoccus sp. I52.16.1]|uniref:extracellular solute-binding protein n=1 Tax=Acuticoccus sp. I52.16.1 TaxID=2928472 RepID=UPI001FD3AB42|nr:extracellular solute-binding protein [Acuticoccus sp. I52.16.1]UOM36154.1 extracellular solute-binding protein [Acuticoccus sp. I52.16.1]
MHKTITVTLLASLLMGASAMAEEVNVYSSRHYDTDDAFFAAFTDATGIAVNRIEDDADVLIERIRSEGELGAADVFITVDVGRIARADEAGIFQPLEIEAVEEKVAENLRTDDWTAFSTRARLIFIDKADVSDPPQTYADLADPKYKGMVCTRSSSNVYMQSLLASIIVNEGEDAARAWAEGVMANLARDPEGGDTDQLRGIVSGECDIALANHYYFARGLAGEVSGLTEGIDGIGIVWPNQETNGTHVNISAIGVTKNAPNPENARKLVKFTLTPEAQHLLASGNNEYPVVEGIEPSEAAVTMGSFTADTVPLGDVAAASTAAQKIYNEVGYK